MSSFPIHVRTLGGLEEVLAGELRALGGENIEVGVRIVKCTGDERLLYRANLECRTAIRVLVPLATFHAESEQELYQGVQRIDWSVYLENEGSLAVDPLVRSSFTTHSLFAAQLVKDAIVDQFRDKSGTRPSVDLADPDLRISLHLAENEATIYLDSSGDSLHKRGYRTETGEAPLSEVLAAGILALTGWDAASPLVDPMCGSGTFAIEAALMAANRAPGLTRREFTFMWWKTYNAKLYEELVTAAQAAVKPALEFPIVASDHDAGMIAIARRNAEAAGVADLIQFEAAEFADLAPPPAPGTLVMNPPYDERLAVANVVAFHQQLGDVLKQRYAGYAAWIFTGNTAAAKQIGLRTTQRLTLFNGPIECRLLRYDVYEGRQTSAGERQREEPRSDESLEDGSELAEEEISNSPAAHEPIVPFTGPMPAQWKEQAAVFRNRLTRMAKHWGKWARRQGITCYRVYDRDIPEIPLCLDLYEGHVVAAEYERPHTRSPSQHAAWLELMLVTVAEMLKLERSAVFLRRRERQRGLAQYEKQDQREERLVVQEGGHKFLVNLSDYLDTGLFLDHRQTRALVERDASGCRFLNLFGYTGAFTVYAAAGGAVSTTTVDLSHNYLSWTEDNLRTNGLWPGPHELIRSDALEFLRQRARVHHEPFDLAVVDPPTFSNSKSTRLTWDVQKQHADLLNLVLGEMSPGGRIYFSTNFRRFQLAEKELAGCRFREISQHTVPPDFRNKRIHRCWVITKEEGVTGVRG